MYTDEELGALEDSQVAADEVIALATALGTLSDCELSIIVKALARSYMRGVNRGGSIALHAIDEALGQSQRAVMN